MRRLHVFLAVGLLAACASTPDSAPPAAGPVPGTTATGDSVAGSQTPKVNQRLLARGYYAQRIGTGIRYCRRHVPLGSLLPRTECFSETEGTTEADKSDLAIDKLRRGGGAACDVGCLTR